MPVVYAFLTSIATLIGGLLPQMRFFRSVDTRYLIGFAAGTMISIVFFDIMPELQERAWMWVAVGFFFTYLIEKYLLLHLSKEGECEHTSLGWPAIGGIAAESLADGIAIAITYAVSPALGIAVAAAVVAHELPRGFTTTVIFQNAKRSKKAIWIALAIDALFTPVGALIGTRISDEYVLSILGFVAGTFLYVGAADLLPEAHRRFNHGVVLSVLAGVAMIFCISLFIHI